MRFAHSMIVGTVLMVLTTGAGGGTLGLDQVSAKANWVVHADIAALSKTQLGEHIRNKIDNENAESKFAALQAVVGFDPRTDLDGITLYGFGQAKQDGMVIVRGRFDTTQLEILVRANDTYESVTHGEHTIHSWIDERKARRAERLGGEPVRTFGCVIGADRVVLSESIDNVRHAIDVIEGRAESMADKSTLPGLERSEDAGFFIASANIGKMQNIHPRAAMLRNTQGLAFSMSESDGTLHARLTLETQTEEAALNLSKMMDGIIGLAMLNAEANPAGSKLAEAMGVRLDGKWLEITLDVPTADIVQYMEQKPRRGQGHTE